MRIQKRANKKLILFIACLFLTQTFMGHITLAAPLSSGKDTIPESGNNSSTVSQNLQHMSDLQAMIQSNSVSDSDDSEEGTGIHGIKSFEFEDKVTPSFNGKNSKKLAAVDQYEDKVYALDGSSIIQINSSGEILSKVNIKGASELKHKIVNFDLYKEKGKTKVALLDRRGILVIHVLDENGSIDLLDESRTQTYNLKGRASSFARNDSGQFAILQHKGEQKVLVVDFVDGKANIIAHDFKRTDIRGYRISGISWLDNGNVMLTANEKATALSKFSVGEFNLNLKRVSNWVTFNDREFGGIVGAHLSKDTLLLNSKREVFSYAVNRPAAAPKDDKGDSGDKSDSDKDENKDKEEDKEEEDDKKKSKKKSEVEMDTMALMMGMNMMDGSKDFRTHKDFWFNEGKDGMATAVSIASGRFSDPSIWSDGKVPGESARLRIEDGHTVTVGDGVHTIRAITVNKGGSLIFNGKHSTTFNVFTIMGAMGSKIKADYPEGQLDVVFRDLNFHPEDLNEMGGGLLSLGDVEITGDDSQLKRTWAEVGAMVKQGDTTIRLKQDVDWKAGSTLLLSAMDQTPATDVKKPLKNIVPHNEETATIKSIEKVGHEVVITLTEPVKYDHTPVFDGQGNPVLFGFVSKLDRNIVFKSENLHGTRGHTLFAAKAYTRIRWARFMNLGRTRNDVVTDNTVMRETVQLESTGETYVFDVNAGTAKLTKDSPRLPKKWTAYSLFGEIKILDNNLEVQVVTKRTSELLHKGTNQIARYSVHLHHVSGSSDPNQEENMLLEGSTIDGAEKWGFVVHGSNGVKALNNVAWGAVHRTGRGSGAAYALEDGSEFNNEFDGNIAQGFYGTGEGGGKAGVKTGDTGRAGHGFWLHRSGGNKFTNNVVVGTRASGLTNTTYGAGEIYLPKAKGMHVLIPALGIRSSFGKADLISNFTVAGSRDGIYYARPDGGTLFIDPNNRFILKDVTVANVHRHAFNMYHIKGVTMNNIKIHFDPKASFAMPGGNKPYKNGPIGVNFRKYAIEDARLTNIEISGAYVGMDLSGSNHNAKSGGVGYTVVKNTKMDNVYFGVRSENGGHRTGTIYMDGTEINLTDTVIRNQEKLPPARFYIATNKKDPNDSVRRFYVDNDKFGESYSVRPLDAHPDAVTRHLHSSKHDKQDAALSNKEIWFKYGASTFMHSPDGELKSVDDIIGYVDYADTFIQPITAEFNQNTLHASLNIKTSIGTRIFIDFVPSAKNSTQPRVLTGWTDTTQTIHNYSFRDLPYGVSYKARVVLWNGKNVSEYKIAVINKDISSK